MSTAHPDIPPVVDTFATWVVRAAFAGAVVVLGFSLLNANAHLTPGQIVVFYGLPGLLAAVCLLVLRGSTSVRARLAMVLCSGGLGLLIGELGLGLALERAGSGTPEGPRMGDVLAEVRARGDTAYPSVPGNVLVDRNVSLPVEGGTIHPVTTAPAHVTTVLCTSGRVVTYVSDRFGFNNPDSVWDGPVEIAAIGDSYTHGMCVDGPDQFPSRLRAEASTLNLGVRGAGPLQELAILREFAAPLRPPVVVWTYYEGNDQYDYGRELGRDWLTAYRSTAHGQRLAERGPAVDTAYRAWLDSLMDAGFYDAGSPDPPRSMRDRLADAARLSSLRRFIGAEVPSRSGNLRGLPDVVAQARDEVEAWGGQFVFVYMPAFARYSTPLSGSMWDRPRLLATLEERGMRVVDLDEAFTDRGDPKAMWASPGGHLTPEGYAVTAAAVLDAVR